MAHTFDFAVLRLIPDAARGESINLGVVIFHEGSIDVRLGEVLTRARSLFPELTDNELTDAVGILQRLGDVPLSAHERHRALARVGAFALGELGSFTVSDDKPETYSSQVSMLLATFVASPRSTRSKVRNASKLATEVRKVFRKEKVLATIGDAGALSEHKIVPEWPIPNRPSIRADLALRNGVMRVCELVDLDLVTDGPPPAALFEGVVTLDVAQREAQAQQRVFAYRAKGPAARIDEALAIARMHASEFVDWNKADQREGFIHQWITAAAR
jgi:Protein of unknown function (DUF3037)